VFPQLRPYLFSSPLDKPTFSGFTKALLKKLAKQKDEPVDWMNSDIYNQKINSEFLDVVVKTDFGFFIIKDFGHGPVTVTDIEKILRTIRSHFSKIFRIICVAKSYDSPLQGESLEKIMTKLSSETNIDLLTEEKVGYSVLWIS
jgi:hypothetical protein